MPAINIVRPFEFTYRDGKTERFLAGHAQSVPEEVAEHPFALAHTDNPPPRVISPGTPEYAQAMARKMADEKIAKAVLHQRAEHAKTDVLDEDRIAAIRRDAEAAVRREQEMVAQAEAASNGEPAPEEADAEEAGTEEAGTDNETETDGQPKSTTRGLPRRRV